MDASSIFDFDSFIYNLFPTYPTTHQESHTSFYNDTHSYWYTPALTQPESLVPAPYFWMAPGQDQSQYDPLPEIHQPGGTYAGTYTKPGYTAGSSYNDGPTTNPILAPERIERTVRRKPPVQGTPYSAPSRRAPIPCPPTADISPSNKRSKKPPTATEKHTYNLTPGPDSQLRTVICRIASCTSACLGKEDLVRHVQLAHGISSKHNNHYRCTFADCPHVSFGKDALVYHMKVTHNFVMRKEQITEAVSLLCCPWRGCGNEVTPSSFQRHISTHANTTFRCPICPRNRKFARISAYQKHFRDEHHDELIAGRYRYIEEASRLTD